MAFITTPEVKAIRNQLKEFFPNLKFSVKKRHHSSVTITILKGDVDFSEVLNGKGNTPLNYFYPENYNKETGQILRDMLKIVKEAPASVTGEKFFDKSDSQTDYFHVSYYMDFKIGDYDKPYQQIEKKKKVNKK